MSHQVAIVTCKRGSPPSRSKWQNEHEDVHEDEDEENPKLGKFLAEITLQPGYFNVRDFVMKLDCHSCVVYCWKPKKWFHFWRVWFQHVSTTPNFWQVNRGWFMPYHTTQYGDLIYKWPVAEVDRCSFVSAPTRCDAKRISSLGKGKFQWSMLFRFWLKWQ